ncbi:MAG: ATP-binding protein, partial [Deltaproteobacteria bacterium]|nr:ATP-binding protein [Deltaproteobacteria bacterium]
MTTVLSKLFNTTGPCNPLDHYMLPTLPRLPEVRHLKNSEEYFVLHAPRQSGKTTIVKAEVARIYAVGSYYALYCSLDELRATIDVEKAMNKLIGNLYGALRISHVDALKRAASDGFLTKLNVLPDFIESPVKVWLRTLCAWLDKDLVIFFDEADCLRDLVLLSFLSQLRLGYIERPEAPFPRSVALIGMRNIRDYKFQSRSEPTTFSSSSLCNIISEVLTLANFTEEEIKTLYAQHTEATGQVFEND